MTVEAKTQKISEYLWCRIKGRMDELGFSPAELAKRTGQSEPNISRMLARKVTNIKYLAELRKTLLLPDDELETRYESYADDMLNMLARLMAEDMKHAEAFMEDVDYLAKLYKSCQRVNASVVLASAKVRATKGTPDQDEALRVFADLKKKQAELEKRKRKLAALLT